MDDVFSAYDSNGFGTNEDTRESSETDLLAAAAADEERLEDETNDTTEGVEDEESSDNNETNERTNEGQNESAKVSENEDEDYVESEEEPDSEEKKSPSPEIEQKKKRGRRGKLSKEELQLLAIGNACRRSDRQRKEIQRYVTGSDSDEKPRKRGKRRRRRSSEDYSSDNSGSSDSSGSDWGKRRKKKSRNRRSAVDSSEDSAEEARRIAGSRSTKTKVDYREKASDAEIDDDDVLEWADDEPSTADTEQHETIEKVLNHRLGRKGAVGHSTTDYNVEDRGDPNGAFDYSKEEGEKQFLIKWVGWSHIHNTWESINTLKNGNVKGLKKVDNYLKRVREIEKWKKTVDKEYIEYFDCEQEMNQELCETYKIVERIIAHQTNKDRNTGDAYDYYIKWCSLPYSDSTWEDSALISRSFQSKIDDYWERVKSLRTPSKLCRALRKRPRFVPYQEQPDYVGTEELRLRDYQLDGLNWLLHSWSKTNSVILADEMGLGKTIQCISFLSALFYDHEVYGPFLIVVPLSTMAAWQTEFENWSPDINIVVYLGDVTSRDLIRQFELFKFDTRKLKANCVLTTYEILLKDKSYLGGFDWPVLMIDEAHRLKNDESLLYRSLMEFSSNHRLLITGTPLQNSLKELWALLHFIMPETFDDWLDFEYKHKDAEMKGFASLHEILRPYLLRRMKKDVEKSLPAKVEQILRVDMTAIQKQYYKWILTKNYKELTKGLKGSIGSFINIVMELKKCCNHSTLVRPPEIEFSGPQERLQQLLKSSGKLILLDKLLCRLKETDHRVLIFSQMVMMLDIIQEYLRLRKFSYQRLDGSIRGDLRKQALNHFNAPNSNDFCFLLSTRAGGLGINLATADTVIIFDSDWNPQNDLQAQSRAHRIGQTKQVNIYRLVTKTSVEEDIVERAKKKLVLDHLVIQRMDTTGKTVLSKHAVSNNATSNVPFDKQELSAVLKFGAEELFKEKEGEEEEPDVDIDDILQRAETREMENQAQPNELLDAFKVANFTIDEEKDIKEQLNWDEIIPEDERKKIEQEEREQWEAQFMLGPRQRKQIQHMARNEDSDEDWEKMQSRKRKRKGGEESDSDSSDDEDRQRGFAKRRKTRLHGFTETEIRKLDAIATDAELDEHSAKELRQLCEELIKGCQEAMTNGEKASSQPQEDGKKKQDRGPTFKLGGIDVYVRPIVKMQADLEPLTHAIPENPSERKHFELPGKPRPNKAWDVVWEDSDDVALMRGIYEYGMGSWDQIKMDPELGLTEKVMLPDKNKKPQNKHLQNRGEYLLKFLQKQLKLPDPNAKLRKTAPALASADKKEKQKPKKTEQSKKLPKTGDSAVSKSRTKQIKADAVSSQDSKVTKDKKQQQKNRDIEEIRAKIIELAVNKKYGAELENRKGKIFQKCIEVTRPVLKYMKRLVGSQNEGDSARNLVKVGNHICQYLASKYGSDSLLEKWHSYLWIFLSEFTKSDAGRLAVTYKKALENPGGEQNHTAVVVKDQEQSERKQTDRREEQEGEKKHKHHHHHHHRHQKDKDRERDHHHDRSSKHHHSPHKSGTSHDESRKNKERGQNWSHTRYEEPRYQKKREQMNYNDRPNTEKPSRSSQWNNPESWHKMTDER